VDGLKTIKLLTLYPYFPGILVPTSNTQDLNEYVRVQ
jgi:hypothetical protein